MRSQLRKVGAFVDVDSTHGSLLRANVHTSSAAGRMTCMSSEQLAVHLAVQPAR